eukprot:COSAG02_NODE_2994_length_7586_cov_3.858822_9_plen_60_part_00
MGLTACSLARGGFCIDSCIECLTTGGGKQAEALRDGRTSESETTPASHAHSPSPLAVAP